MAKIKPVGVKINGKDKSASHYLYEGVQRALMYKRDVLRCFKIGKYTVRVTTLTS